MRAVFFFDVNYKTFSTPAKDRVDHTHDEFFNPP